MHFTGLIGILVGLCVVWYGVLERAVKPEIFLDPHALILVIGGTIAAGLIAFPLSKFTDLFDFLILAVRSQEKQRYLLAKELLELIPNSGRLTSSVPSRKLGHPLMQEGYELILKHSVTESDFRKIMLQKNLRYRDKYLSDARTLTAMAKFPPAFGLLGATTGMISMLTGLTEDSQGSIGPSMAVALVATFWGIALANFVILPLADRATKLSSDETQLRTMIINGLHLIYQEAEPISVMENVSSYLSPSERTGDDWRSFEARFVKKGTSANPTVKS
jgi:chemotaxis protein MotA